MRRVASPGSYAKRNTFPTLFFVSNLSQYFSAFFNYVPNRERERNAKYLYAVRVITLALRSVLARSNEQRETYSQHLNVI
jgi:hypothetical protein